MHMHLGSGLHGRRTGNEICHFLPQILSDPSQVYSDHCHFADSRDDFGDIGLQNWVKAVNFLFIGEESKLALTDEVVLDEAGRTITFKGWRQVPRSAAPHHS